MDNILKNIYFNPKHPASFGSIDKLYKAAKNKNKFITRLKVKKFLQSQPAYIYHRQRRINYPTAKTYAGSPDEVWQIDLTTLIHLADENDGIKYLLIVIDVFSRYLFIEPIKNKNSKSVAEALNSIFKKGRIPAFIASDHGKEFLSETKKLLDILNIGYYTLNSPSKASIAERVQLTIKSRIFKYLTFKNTRRYIDKLQDFVSSYNNTVHRTIKMTPNKKFQSKKGYYIPQNQDIVKKVYKFKINDKVVVSRNSDKMFKSYEGTFNKEIFSVSKRFYKSNLPMYHLRDLNNDIIEGSFYEQELQLFNINSNTIYQIEKIIKTRGRGKNKQFLVRWQDYDKSFDSWVNANQIINYK